MVINFFFFTKLVSNLGDIILVIVHICQVKDISNAVKIKIY